MDCFQAENGFLFWKKKLLDTSDGWNLMMNSYVGINKSIQVKFYDKVNDMIFL